jgi:DNA-binding response OmpR family regulator
MKDPCILIIEDNVTIAEFIELILLTYAKRDGCTCTIIHAYDGIQGLEHVWKFQPDLILLDIQLPWLNGHNVLRSLRSEGNATPVLIMTANADPDERRKSFLAGCDSYITKPFRPDGLYHLVQEQLQKRGDLQFSQCE